MLVTGMSFVGGAVTGVMLYVKVPKKDDLCWDDIGSSFTFGDNKFSCSRQCGFTLGFFFFKVVLLACAPRRESWQARETLSRYVFYFKNL